MEFERAIFRVYEKCMEGLREDEPESFSPKSCRVIESVILCLASFLFFSLIYLHSAFVGSPGCLPSILSHQLPPIFIGNHTLNSTTVNKTIDDWMPFRVRADQILQIDVYGRFVPASVNSGTNNGQNEEVSMLGAAVQPREFLRHEIDKFNSASTLTTNVSYSNETMTSTHSIIRKKSRYIPARGHDYEFAFHVGIMSLSDEFRSTHQFEVLNISLSGSECFGNPLTMTLIPLGGLDTIIRNFLMNTFHREGVLVASSGDYYTWTRREALLSTLSFADKLSYKFLAIFMSLASFFVVSSVTALLVRVLISSGVVTLFPMFWLVQVGSYKSAIDDSFNRA